MKRILFNSCLIVLALSALIVESKASQNAVFEKWLSFHDFNAIDFRDTALSYSLKLENETPISSLKQSEFAKLIAIYSPDSSLYVDLDSYSLSIEKDSLGKYFSYGSEPDTEVSLFNLKTAKKYKLIFLGPDYRIEEAFWQNNECVVLLGLSFKNSFYLPTMWIFDLKNNTQVIVQNRTNPKTYFSDYVKKIRLKQVEFK